MLCMLVCTSIVAWSVPAYPGVIKATQPDGSVIEIILQGDENMHWAKSVDGYTLLRNSDNFWTLACPDEQGWLHPSQYIYRNDAHIAQEASVAPGLRFPQEQLLAQRHELSMRRAKNSDLQVDGTFPAKGENKLLLLMLNYSDTDTTFSTAHFDKMMNEKNYNSIGSFRDFYLENSYGQLDITTVVTRWVTLPYAKSYYGSDRAIEMIQHGLNIIQDEIDLADFDNDGDGILDGLAVIHQGTGQEYSGNPGEIWSHSNIIYGMAFDGIQVRRYTIQPELLTAYGDMARIGVICHEFGHNLGAPDFYDSDYEGSGGYYQGTGTWDLMSSGAWNGTQGDRPAHINMWQKIQCGWVTPVELTTSQSVTNMLPAHSNAVAYRFDTTVPGEYFILENRQQEGAFDVALPGHGLLVYHANDAKIKNTVYSNMVNASYPQAMYLVCASAPCDPDYSVSSYGDVNTAGAAFPGTSHVTDFNDATLPSTRSTSGRNTYKGLSQIKESVDGVVSFTFTNEGAPLSPINFTARNERGCVMLNWEMPQGAKGVKHFTIYRNDVSLGTTTDYSFIDTSLPEVNYVTYYIDAVYNDGLISPYTSVSTRVPVNFVTEITSEVNTSDVTLQWNIDKKLTRMTSIASDYTIVDYNMPVVEYAHRFRADDLKIFKGYKIRNIAYLPYQAQKDMKITLRVYEADVDGTNHQLISERVVKEYGTAVWNTTLLTKSVEITGEKELWVAIRCESSTGVVRIFVDKGPIVEDYGNWVKLGEDEWTADKAISGNFFLYVPLTAPATPTAAELTDLGAVENPYLDMLFPVGYAVYRDEQLLTRTTGTTYVDAAPLDGTHHYSITSLYKGNNESVPLTIEVADISTGLHKNEAHVCRIVVDESAIYLPGYDGELCVVDMMGRVVYSGRYGNEMRIALQQGLYIVRTAQGAQKISIR